MVDGHCIGIDPYYLVHKAEEVGHHPDVILAGRRINDRMGEYVVNRLVKAMIKSDIKVSGANELLLGITFKENCHDIRNSKIVDMAHEMQDYNVNLNIWEPWARADKVKHEYGLEMIEKPDSEKYDVVIAAVGHSEFKALGEQGLANLKKDGGLVFDLKYIFDKRMVTERL